VRVPLALLVAAMVLAPWSAWAQRLTLWHAYRGNEQRALELAVDAWRGRHPGVAVEVLAMPYESYASKLEAAIPHGNGPDLFVDAHERVTSYRGRGLLRPITAQVPGGLGARFDDTATRAFTADGALWAVPLAVKCNALYVNPALLPAGVTVRSLRDLDALRSVLPRGSYPLVYESSSAYVHAAFAHAFGSGLLGDDGRYLFVGDGAERSVQRVLTMLDAGTIPEEASGALLSQLFLSGRAVAAISGPWFAAEIGDRMRYTVQPLPTVPEAGDRALEPFATVEGAMVSARASNPALAESLALDLASVESSAVRAQVGRQVVVTREAWGRVTALANDPLLAVFRQAALGARPMPVHPRMRATWEPARMALAKSLRRDGSVRDALNEGARRFADVTRPLPPRRDGTLALLMVGAVALWAALSAVRRARDPDFRVELRRSRSAYAWVAHAAVSVSLLVVTPVVIGAATSLYASEAGRSYYVGLANYWEILTARGGPLLATGSFYRVLLVTVLWTVVNIALHLALGVSLALLLSRPTLKLKAAYRVLLILPWAVPSYVTALAWKGMFHRQFGAANALLVALGGEPVSWFARFSTAFAANVATNAWLGFPFMMVVTIGALAGIPKDLYEAAAVDGATPWQQFWKITVPMLRPSLGPSVALGTIWTFNQFNVVFLVSGGEPDGETEILVSEAYRWAFTRQAQYGYAAAYSVLIFLLLAFATRRREGAR
jgi:arabinogalactan oligomer/maltooligosaccharide transport system permease protein